MLRAFVLLPVLALSVACEGDINDLPTTPDPVIVTETFTGDLTINGATTHNVFTSATGAVSATITSLGDEPPAKVGFSMGTLGSTGVCTAVMTNDSAVVTSSLVGTVSTLAGSLCVRIYDVGSLTGTVPYTFTVTHP
jgi:hypothetical protein